MNDAHHESAKKALQAYHGAGLRDALLTTNNVLLETLTVVRPEAGPAVVSSASLTMNGRMRRSLGRKAPIGTILKTSIRHAIPPGSAAPGYFGASTMSFWTLSKMARSSFCSAAPSLNFTIELVSLTMLESHSALVMASPSWAGFISRPK